MPANRLTARTARVLAAAATAAVMIPLAATPAAAAGSAYGEWSETALHVPVTGFPDAAFTTDSSSVTTPSGVSTFLNDSTPFGAAYGSSRGQNYLSLRPSTGGANGQPSLTTLTFAAATPVGWGFTLGDIDADQVRITATGVGGVRLTAAQLGFQSTFNYCVGTPKPSVCGSGPNTDVPTWDPATSTLRGNVNDTNGASGWFRPTAPVTSVSFTYSVLSGAPVYQIWMAAPDADISGRITSGCGIPPGTAVRLRTATGAAVLDSAGQPVAAAVDADGTYSFSGVATGRFRVVLPVPAGYAATGPTSRTADTSGGDVRGADFRIGCTPEPAPPVTVPENGGPVRVPVTPDRDPETPVTVPEPPDHGKVQVEGDHLVYTPDKGYAGKDSFIYKVTAKDGQAKFVKVSVDVTKPKPKPRPTPTPPQPHPAPPADHPQPQQTGPELAASGADGSLTPVAVGLLGAGALTVAATRVRGRRR
ncbi:Ig-like domain-containing protein [Streptomyces sp. CBMA29]|uniref:Ig-like domain-containing protein n=1 Tax=Streptomyces sp. CBMA29 TaxID=1896314 RepID=UPI001661EE0B|nr:Ig-like domain-containing protein [Streptomyces sp. CBMA29]